MPKDVAISIENRGPQDSEEGRYRRRLVDVIRVCAGNSDPMLVLADIEEHLRGRYAKAVTVDG